MNTELTWEATWRHRLDETFDHLEKVIGAQVALLQGVPAEVAALWGLSEEEAEEGDVIERYARHHAVTGRPLHPLPEWAQAHPSWRESYIVAHGVARTAAELDRYEENTVFVVRRASGGHALGALHPSGQWIYAKYVDESDVNAPDYYGFTLDTQWATRVSVKEVTREWSPLNPAHFVREALWSHAEENGLDGIAAALQVSRDELEIWCNHASWTPVPLALSWRYLSDFNGFVGYQAEWGDHLEEALVFSLRERRDQDPDVQLAAGLGTFIRVQTDANGRPVLTLE